MKVKGRLRRSERIWFKAGLLIALALACAGHRMAARFSRDSARMVAQRAGTAELSEAKVQLALQWSQFNGH